MITNLLDSIRSIGIENRRLGGSGPCVVTIELGRNEAEALCFNISSEMASMAHLTEPPRILPLGVPFEWYGVKTRIVEKV